MTTEATRLIVEALKKQKIFVEQLETHDAVVRCHEVGIMDGLTRALTILNAIEENRRKKAQNED